MYSRNEVVSLAKSWLGKNTRDGSYMEILNIYNSLDSSELPRGLKMKPGWAWCAATWSAIAIKLGYLAIMPIEISCGKLIEAAKAMDCWEEDDGYVPNLGDGILYDWDDSGIGDNTGWPDHIGIVTYVNEEEGYFEVIEGNYNGAVKARTVSINGKYIRGFVAPKYDDSIPEPVETPKENKIIDLLAREVIVGKWGSGQERRNRLAAAGYDYSAIQARVNEILNGSAVEAKDPIQDQDQPVSKKVTSSCYACFKDPDLAGTYITTANLYCRNDAGKNKKALCKIPKGTAVKNYGFYSTANGVRWLSIQFVMDGVQYTGFSSIEYLTRR